MERTSKFRRELPCTLNDNEKRAYAEELARITQEQAEHEAAKKEIAGEYKARIDKCIATSRLIARKISTGREMREVECFWELDPSTVSKRLIRADSFAEVEVATMTAEEMQRELDFPTDANIVDDEPIGSGEEMAEYQSPPFECKGCKQRKVKRICGTENCTA